jgi:hypothetical protein
MFVFIVESQDKKMSNIDYIKNIFGKVYKNIFQCPFCKELVKRSSSSYVYHFEHEHNLTLENFKKWCFEEISKDSLGEQIISFYVDNISYKFVPIRGKNGVSQKFGLNETFVEDYFKHQKIDIRQIDTPRLELEKSELGQEIKKNYLSGMSIKQTAKKLGVPHQLVHKSLRNQNIIRKRAKFYDHKCILCNETFNILGLSSHVRKKHKIEFKVYKEKLIEDFIDSEQYQELIDDYTKFRRNQGYICFKYKHTIDILKEVLVRSGIRIRKGNESLTKGFFWFLYKDEYYQSSWEIKLAWWLEHNNIKFQSHKDIKPLFYFDKKNKLRKYFSDFYIPEWNKFIEVKGKLTKEEIYKHEKVKKNNPDIEIEIWGYNIFVEKSIFSIDKKLGLNIYEYAIYPESKEYQIDTLEKNKDEIFNNYKNTKDIYSCQKQIVRKFNVRFKVLYCFEKKYRKEFSQIRKEKRRETFACRKPR